MNKLFSFNPDAKSCAAAQPRVSEFQGFTPVKTPSSGPKCCVVLGKEHGLIRATFSDFGQILKGPSTRIRGIGHGLLLDRGGHRSASTTGSYVLDMYYKTTPCAVGWEVPDEKLHFLLPEKVSSKIAQYFKGKVRICSELLTLY